MELKQFPRIQTVTFSQNDFDGIQHFPECGGIGIFIGTVRNHHQGKAVKALKYTLLQLCLDGDSALYQ